MPTTDPLLVGQPAAPKRTGLAFAVEPAGVVYRRPGAVIEALESKR